jgi:hypothetical protein
MTQHHASSRARSSSSGVILPFVARPIASQNFAGTIPRWRHFRRAASDTPSCSAAQSINVQSMLSMIPNDMDKSSNRQRTNWKLAARDILSNVVNIMTHDDSESAKRATIRQRTKQAREAINWDVETMARALGRSPEAYRKYENRGSSALPISLLDRFCKLTGVDPAWLAGCDTKKRSLQKSA